MLVSGSISNPFLGSHHLQPACNLRLYSEPIILAKNSKSSSTSPYTLGIVSHTRLFQLQAHQRRQLNRPTSNSLTMSTAGTFLPFTAVWNRKSDSIQNGSNQKQDRSTKKEGPLQLPKLMWVFGWQKSSHIFWWGRALWKDGYHIYVLIYNINIYIYLDQQKPLKT